jgi:hypothetical protein
MSYRKEQHELLVELSTQAFERHVIRKSDEDGGRWLLQRRYKDDTGWDSVYFTEVIVLHGGKIYVGGDITPVVFAYGPAKNPRDTVRWMGECKDLGHYVAQKAAIGMTDYLITEYSHEAAMETLRDWEKELQEQQKEDPSQDTEEEIENLKDIFEDNRRYQYSEVEMVEKIHETMGSDWLCDRRRFGHILKPAVYYAHAAMAKLCAIWRQTDAALAATLHLVKDK